MDGKMQQHLLESIMDRVRPFIDGESEKFEHGIVFLIAQIVVIALDEYDRIKE